MFHHIDITSRGTCRSKRAQPQLRAQVIRLRRGIDAHEQLYSTWQQSRRLRETHAEVRFHLIEAQLARLAASDRMGAGASLDCTVSLTVSPSPVVFSISAYRT